MEKLIEFMMKKQDLMYSISEHFLVFIIVSTTVVIFICGRYYFAHNKSYKNEAIDYAKWENFAKVIKRAMIACENSGHSIPDDFPEVRKIVEAGVTTNPKKIMNWTKITEDLLSWETSNSGIKCWQRQHIIQELLRMRNLRFFKMPDIWDYMVD